MEASLRTSGERRRPERGLFGQWVRATWGGWVLGVPLIVVLALLGELVGIGGSQTLVGVAMGTGVGLLQARVLRRTGLARFGPWLWSSIVCLGLPFFVVDVLSLLGRPLPYLLYVAVACGGVIAGVVQAFILRRRLPGAAWWAPTCVLAWLLASGTAAAADSLSKAFSMKGIHGLVAYLGLVVCGGLVLGVISGACLAALAPRAALRP